MSRENEEWRLMGQEKYLAGSTMYKIVFPDFWKKAYEDKNPFFQMIDERAHMFVEILHQGEEYLKGDDVQHFWHEHCEFCMAKAVTDEQGTFYCTKDLRHWICGECFEAFRERLGLNEAPSDELFD